MLAAAQRLVKRRDESPMPRTGKVIAKELSRVVSDERAMGLGLVLLQRMGAIPFLVEAARNGGPADKLKLVDYCERIVLAAEDLVLQESPESDLARAASLLAQELICRKTGVKEAGHAFCLASQEVKGFHVGAVAQRGAPMQAGRLPASADDEKQAENAADAMPPASESANRDARACEPPPYDPSSLPPVLVVPKQELAEMFEKLRPICCEEDRKSLQVQLALVDASSKMDSAEAKEAAFACWAVQWAVQFDVERKYTNVQAREVSRLATQMQARLGSEIETEPDKLCRWGVGTSKSKSNSKWESISALDVEKALKTSGRKARPYLNALGEVFKVLDRVPLTRAWRASPAAEELTQLLVNLTRDAKCPQALLEWARTRLSHLTR